MFNGAQRATFAISNCKLLKQNNQISQSNRPTSPPPPHIIYTIQTTPLITKPAPTIPAPKIQSTPTTHALLLPAAAFEFPLPALPRLLSALWFGMGADTVLEGKLERVLIEALPDEGELEPDIMEEEVDEDDPEEDDVCGVPEDWADIDEEAEAETEETREVGIDV